MSSSEDSGEDLDGYEYTSQFNADDISEIRLFDIKDASDAESSFGESSSSGEQKVIEKPKPKAKKKKKKKSGMTVKRISQDDLANIMKEHAANTTTRDSALSEDIRDLQDYVDAPSVIPSRKRKPMALKKSKSSRSTASVRRKLVAKPTSVGLSVDALKRRLIKNPKSEEVKAQLRLAQLNEVSPEFLNALLAKKKMLKSKVNRLKKELMVTKRDLIAVEKNITTQIQTVNSL